MYEIKIVYFAHKYFLEAKSDLAAAKKIILVKNCEIQMVPFSIPLGKYFHKNTIFTWQ